ncbi:LacI family DNA-binding transcriptional regulator [Paenibacillus sp. KQZ6P-2]|uniref:LacI family DNA-binding transcriptional regulator n=1 Tax=Paenibacillus mangrovi TaxID=2931978 RepID=A0A9X2B242_9BACL|nr:LacI family DNA-binding transcriptional regulator [Paenibacillus mangrovi]MCJ8012164.1 LacI family DNA-binding transcriptional regulator [Paenibacillus mangrovi]
MKDKVTMQDIAERLNISKNSVSQALSGKDGVSEETRKIILETAHQMGYVYSPSRKKRASEAELTGTIALIASDFAFSMKSFFGEIYLSIERETVRRGGNLIIQSISKQAAEKRSLPTFLQNQTVDGVLVLSHITTDYINTITGTGVPTVLIDHHHPSIHADCILTNNRFSAYEVIRHLAELGHRKIGIFSNTSFSPSYYERWEGFVLAMNDFGLEINDSWVIKDAKEEATYMLEKIKSIEELPTAWFCVNDGLGFILNSVLQQLGYRVPEDVSVVSFDNGYLSQVSTPQITTMDVDLKLYGRKAVEQLFWRINHPDEPLTEMLLPTKLVKRESSGPAPQ